jgi:flagellar motor switch protein FliM
MSVLTIDELTYDEYVRDLPVPTHLSFLTLDPLPGVALLQLPVSTAMVMVDLMLGGQGRPLPEERPLTEIESGLIRTLLERALRDLTYAFESVVALQPTIVGQESNPQFAQIAAPSDMVVSITFDLQLATSRAVEHGVASICYPYDSLHPILEAVAGTVGQRTLGSHAAMETRERLTDRMESVPVEVAVEFAPTSMSSREILAMRPGDLLALGHPADQALTATAGGVPLFAVRPARRGKRVAAQVVSRAPAHANPNRGTR